MRKILITLTAILAVSNVYAWDIKVEDGNAICIQCESYDVYDSTSGQTTTVHVDSAPLTIVNQLKSEGFKKDTKREWLKAINERMTETYAQKRAREYPSTGDQLDALWKIVNGNPDAEALAIKQKIQDVKQKYPKPQ